MITHKVNRLTGSVNDAGSANEYCHDWKSTAKDYCQSSFHGAVSTKEIVADAASDVREHYRALLRGLAWPGNGSTDSLQTLAITSCQRGEGVSSVAAQLAVTAALSGAHRILLVDANVTCPSLQYTFGLPSNSGQTNASQPSVQSTRYRNLGLLTVGIVGGDDSAGTHGLTGIYASAERFSQFVAATKRSFDLAVFDMPAANPANLSLQLFATFDGVVLVAEAERVRREVAEHTKQKLTKVGANLLGVVLNKRTYHVPNWLYRTL